MSGGLASRAEAAESVAPGTPLEFWISSVGFRVHHELALFREAL